MQGLMVNSKIKLTMISAVVCLASCAGPVVDEWLSAGTQISDWVYRNAEFLDADVSGATMVFDPAGLIGAPREDDIRRGLLDLGWIEMSDNANTNSGEANVRVELSFYQLTAMEQRRIGTELDNWDLVIEALILVDEDVFALLGTGFPRGGQLISEITADGPYSQ
jgi:hypothetical protein